MELNERETLIKVEQRLNDSAQNQSQIMSDLKEIFQRIENESKTVTTIRGELKGHSDNSKLRWESLEKRLGSFEKAHESLEKKTEDNEKAVNNLKEEQGKFEETVKASARVTKWVIGIIAAIGSMIGTLALLLEIIEKIKG